MSKKKFSKDDIQRTANERFGFESLRPGQEEAIRAVLNRQDTLVVQPTGSGKSAIYQIAGLLIDGPTVVVSPLIALQKDQVDSIRSHDAAEAAVINSRQRVGQLRDTFEKLDEGSLEYLFLAPEQLTKDETLEHLRQHPPSLFVIDEAHCISEWGHDFRPDYLRLGPVIEELGHPVVLAMTATASPDVRAEIIQRLGLRHPQVFVSGFDRPNIHLSVRTFPTQQAKLEALLTAIEEAPKPGIVYVATRKHAEEITAALEDRGIAASFYHGGMPSKERDQIQEDFREDRTQVIVATNAFGMGVDKANVRFVFHYDISDSLDSYYQEVGRAGRDGSPADAVLFYRPEDLSVQRFLGGGGKLDEKTLAQLAQAVQQQEGPIAEEELHNQTDLSQRKLTKALNRLEDAGLLERLPTGEISAKEDAPDVKEAAHLALEENERRREHERLRLEKMQAFAEMQSCRREYLLQYFGQSSESACHRCDNCERPAQTEAPQQARPTATPELRKKPAPPSAPTASQPYAPKTRVTHKEWGKGLVEGYDGDKINILFDEVGHKTLSVDFVVNHNLLATVA